MGVKSCAGRGDAASASGARIDEEGGAEGAADGICGPTRDIGAGGDAVATVRCLQTDPSVTAAMTTTTTTRTIVTASPDLHPVCDTAAAGRVAGAGVFSTKISEGRAPWTSSIVPEATFSTATRKAVRRCPISEANKPAMTALTLSLSVRAPE